MKLCICDMSPMVLDRKELLLACYRLCRAVGVLNPLTKKNFSKPPTPQYRITLKELYYGNDDVDTSTKQSRTKEVMRRYNKINKGAF